MAASLLICLFTLFVAAQCENCTSSPKPKSNKLKFVIVIFRHGARTITGSYPTDPYGDISFWPGGYGQLTNKGKQRQYRLGQWFRERYQGFLPAAYSHYDVLVKSSDYDRTLMSAQAHLAGLYPPEDDQGIEPGLSWQPVPVHTRPREEDAVLAQERPCPAHRKLYDALLDTAPFQRYRRQVQDLCRYLSNQTGLRITELIQLADIYDTLLVESEAGYQLPPWTSQVFPQPLKRWASLTFAMPSYTPAMARLMTGPLLHELVDDYLNVTRHEDASYQKYRVYSAHDSTVANVLTSLGAFNNLPPPYASALIFELRKNQQGYFVNLFYKNGTVPVEMTIKGCEFNCDLDSFLSIVKPLTLSPEDYEEACYE